MHFDTQLIASHLKKEEITRRHAAFYDQHAFLKTCLCWKKGLLKTDHHLGNASFSCRFFPEEENCIIMHQITIPVIHTWAGGPESSMFICKKNCHYFPPQPKLNLDEAVHENNVLAPPIREVLLICMHISFRLENPLGPAGAINQVGLAPLTLRQKRVKS